MKHDNITESIPGATGHAHFSKAAVASGVLGIIGIASLWIFGLGLIIAAIGAVCGHMAFYHIGNSGKKLKGRRLAMFGLGSSYLAMLFFPLLLGMVTVSIPAWKEYKISQISGLEESSKTNASRLYVACEAYSRANRGRYPDEWDDLSGKYLPANELRRLQESKYPGGETVTFELVPHERPVLAGINGSVMVIQQVAPPGVKKVAVVYADGNVALILNPDRP